MRKISAFLAIAVALSGALWFAAGVDLAAVLSTGLFMLALMLAAIVALRGGDLIFLAAAWSLYVGMNLAAYTDVIYAYRGNASATGRYGSILLTLLLAVGVVGLATAFVAHHKERTA